MSNIILFGATGHAGRAIAQELHGRGHRVTAVVRNESKAAFIAPFVYRFITAEVTSSASLTGVCAGQEVAISAMGKSVSPFDFSKPGFRQVDFEGNVHILKEAADQNVDQFIYVSAFGSATMKQLNYFKVHYEFSELLRSSGLQYTILEPPAIMSSLLDIITLAKKGWSATIGKGDCRTNPISEQDLARICADAIGQPSSVIAAGGKKVYTRHEINEIIQSIVAPHRKVRRISEWTVKSALPFWKVFNPNMYDKLAFFLEVMRHDVLAPEIGEVSLEEYILNQFQQPVDGQRLKTTENA